MKQSFLLCCLGSLLASSPAFALEPSNPQALPEARAVLNYLGSLPGRLDQPLLSAQQLGDAAAGIQWYLSDTWVITREEVDWRSTTKTASPRSINKPAAVQRQQPCFTEQSSGHLAPPY